MGKKGFVFTLISILFVSVILIAFLIQATNTTRVKTEESRVKVETVNAFLKSIKNTHINNSIQISTTRAFDAMVECIREQKRQGESDNIKKFYINPDEVLMNIIEYADLSRISGQDKKSSKCDTVIKDIMSKDGKYSNDPTELLTLSNTLQELIDAADKIGLDLDFYPATTQNDVPPDPSLYFMKIEQSDPWNVDIEITLDFDLKTKDNSIIWQIRGFKDKARVSIIGSKDPVYAAFEDGTLTISRWDGLDFKYMLDKTKFYDSIAQKDKPSSGKSPPSYLERFSRSNYNDGTGNVNGIKCNNNKKTYCGIETIRKPNDASLPLDGTWIDYLQYEDPTLQGDICTNAPEGFENLRLDTPHRTIYNCQP